MGGMGGKEKIMAYEFVYESEYDAYRSDCSKVLTETCKRLKRKDIIAQFILIGSGGRNLVTRNGDGPFDLDYNLNIIKAPDSYRDDLRKLKDTVRVALNESEGFECFSPAHDSTSCLTAILHFNNTHAVEFSFDVAIVKQNENGNYLRLVHNKNAWGLSFDQYTWNEIPFSYDVKEKAEALKDAGLWEKVRSRYLELKNRYLIFRDKNHPSFVVYVEAVNQVYHQYLS
jgi:hypothetical protein